jgi:hypothetical protein
LVGLAHNLSYAFIIAGDMGKEEGKEGTLGMK